MQYDNSSLHKWPRRLRAPPSGLQALLAHRQPLPGKETFLSNQIPGQQQCKQGCGLAMSNREHPATVFQNFLSSLPSSFNSDSPRIKRRLQISKYSTTVLGEDGQSLRSDSLVCWCASGLNGGHVCIAGDSSVLMRFFLFFQ